MLLSQEITTEIKRIFEPKYGRDLSDDEVVVIADRLTQFTETYMKLKCKGKNEKRHKH